MLPLSRTCLLFRLNPSLVAGHVQSLAPGTADPIHSSSSVNRNEQAACSSKHPWLFCTITQPWRGHVINHFPGCQPFGLLSSIISHPGFNFGLKCAPNQIITRNNIWDRRNLGHLLGASCSYHAFSTGTRSEVTRRRRQGRGSGDRSNGSDLSDPVTKSQRVALAAVYRSVSVAELREASQLPGVQSDVKIALQALLQAG